jgi:hypothetical protein
MSSSRRRRRFLHNFIDRYIEQPRQRQITQSIRKSQRCVSNTLREERCHKRTAHTQKCWIHLAKQDNLRIKPSNVIVGGKGLLSWKKTIQRGTIISKYTGRQCTKEQIDQKYGDGRADYALCNKHGKCVDANYTTDAAARFANDSRGTPFQNNSKIKGNQIFRLKATKKYHHTAKFLHHTVKNIGEINRFYNINGCESYS